MSNIHFRTEQKKLNKMIYVLQKELLLPEKLKSSLLIF